MALTPDLKEMAGRLARYAEFARSGVMRDLERSLCGCDYGSTGNATRQEIERIAELLKLRPGAKLLDVGAGSGWPGLFLAKLTGCDVVVVDIPVAALRIALERANADGQSERCGVVAADGVALPFRDATFDALSHSDLLCCTPDKFGVLRACRRVARDDARTVFTVIAPAPSLTDAERRTAVACGPKFVDTADDYADLLDRSGWQLKERMDLTVELLQFVRAEFEGMQARADALTDLFGSDEFADRIKRQEAMIDAVGAGLLRRELFVALAA
jgi:SAM-dependent methyltransferase